MINTDIDISTRVMETKTKRTGLLIYNRSRQGNEVVVVEWDDSHVVGVMNVNDLSVKIGGEDWVSVYKLNTQKRR